MHFTLLILNIFLPCLHGNYSKILPAFVKYFRPLKPLPLQYNTSRENKVNVIKECSDYNISLKWIQKETNKEIFLLVLLPTEEITTAEEISISQQIYFLTPKFKLYEKYEVNKVNVLQLLGIFENHTYIPKNGIEHNFMKQRNNFHGLKLVGLTEDSKDTYIKNLDEAKYFSSNDTYDVTSNTYGPFYEILRHLQKTLNFTTTLYKRKKKGWGTPNFYSNGSLKSIDDGMVKDLMLGKADLIMASLSILHGR